MENLITTRQIIERINDLKSKENKDEEDYTEIQDLLLEVNEYEHYGYDE